MILYHKPIISLFVLLISFFSYAQNPKVIDVAEGSYGIDIKNKIIVWNYQISDSSKMRNQDVTKFMFDERFSMISTFDSLSYTQSYDIRHNEELFKLYITELPIVHISPDTLIENDPKQPSTFTYTHKNQISNSTVGIEYRGNISLQFPKKSYDLEFWNSPEEKKPVDIQFGNLRKDDDWILDGLYNEPLRLRSYVCNKLWLSIYQPHYLSQEKEAKSGTDLMYTEVFLDNRYMGIYALSEQVDRKLLQLKKYEKGKVKGELFKASSYEGAPAYEKAPRYKNIFPHWAGYEMEYPYINYEAHWKNIYRFTKFVITSKDFIFKKKIKKKFDLDNAIDYFLFVNLIRATDNLGKNIYVARYDENTPYFNVPWDLDGVMGIIQDGKKIATTNDILSNNLLDRLLRVNPDNYRDRLKKRWYKLRQNQFSNESILGSIQERYDFFEKHKIYERESLSWASDTTYVEHLEYIRLWLTQRLQYLDSYFQTIE